jgi:hypothetical protein
VRGRLLRGSRVAAGPPVDGHHLHRLVPGTGNGASVPGRARNRMPGSAATAQYRTCRPATAGTRAGLGGSAPIHTLGHGRAPAVIRLCLRKSERVPSAARPQTCGDEGPRRPPTAGTTHRSQTSVPVRGEYPSRPSPCGRLGWPVTPGTGLPQAAGGVHGEKTTLWLWPVSEKMPPATAWHLLSGRLNPARGSPASRFTFLVLAGRRRGRRRPRPASGAKASMRPVLPR